MRWKLLIKHLMEIMGTDCYYESGSIGLKSVLVADGTADLFVKDVNVRSWDLSPGHFKNLGLKVVLNEKQQIAIGNTMAGGGKVSAHLKLVTPGIKCHHKWCMTVPLNVYRVLLTAFGEHHGI